jgi:ubiquinone/menaquinone biosynthesis C-methylase UbiE
MPFRASFDCLWCGKSWTTRGVDDVEGWAQLCPDCVGRAGDNEFLRFRLRQAFEERATAGRATAGHATAGHAAPTPGTPAVMAVAERPPGASAGRPAASDDLVAYYDARAGEYDDWYLRRGRYSHGPIHDAAWNAELDTAGRWLDELPFHGEIVELAAGTGWWSPLLAAKGNLSLFDAAEAPLDRARDRLLAHGLRAHIHVRDAWAEPDRQVDALFAGFWLSHVPRDRLAAFLGLARRWLKPGGTVAFIDSLPDPESGAADHPRPEGDSALRRLADGREFRIVKVFYTPTELTRAFEVTGFSDARVETTGRFFLLGRGTAT